MLPAWKCAVGLREGAALGSQGSWFPNQNAYLLFFFFNRKGKEQEEHMPGRHCFPVNCSLLRKIDKRQMITHIPPRNKCGKLAGKGQEGGWSRMGGGLGKMRVEIWNVTGHRDSYLVVGGVGSGKETPERSWDSMTEMWADFRFIISNFSCIINKFYLG